MAGFLDPLWLQHDGAAERWRLAREFRYVTRAGQTIAVPAGFTTDLASVPRLLWGVIPPHGRHLPATIIHDWLYDRRLVPRAEADKLFLEGMEILGVSPAVRRAMYAAVRLAGGRAYRT